MQSEQQFILLDWEGLRLAPVEADMMFLANKPYYHDFLSVYQKKHQDFAINFDALKFFKGSRDLDDIWVTLEQLLFDKQDAQERAITIKRLTRGLEGIS